jgi:hypothetical protein
MNDIAILDAVQRDDKRQSLTRLYRFLRDKPGSHKAIVMHWTGFDRIDGLTEHVSFENAILRLDNLLRGHGQRVVREDHRFSLGTA